MAAITSNGTTGNWSSTGVWTGGVVPGTGDTVIWADATCTITVDVDTTVGSSPATNGTAAIAWPSTPTHAIDLVIAAGKKLTLLGDISIAGDATHFGSLTLASGASLIFSPGSGKQYNAIFKDSARIVCNGATNTGIWPDTTGGNHCIVKTDLGAGGSAAVCLAGQGALPIVTHFWGGFTQCAFTEFSNMGNTNDNAGTGVLTYINTDTASWTNAIAITHCTFSACTVWILAETGASTWHGDYQFNNNLFTNSIAGNQFDQLASVGWSIAGTPTGEVRQIKDNGFDAACVVSFDGCHNITVTGNAFTGDMTGGNASDWSSDSLFANNVVVYRNAPGLPATFPMSSHKNNYFVQMASTPQNYFKMLPNTTVRNCIFETNVGAYGVDVGIMYMSSTGTLEVSNCLSIVSSNGSGWTSGYLVLCQTHMTLTFNHNLCWGRFDEPGGGNTFGAVNLGYGGAAFAGQVASCRGNIIYFPSAGAGTHLIGESGSSTYTLDAVTIAGYNGMRNPTGGTVKTSAGAVTTGSVPGYQQIEVTAVGVPLSNGNAQIGTGDLVADPQFVESTNFRGLHRWNSVVYSGTDTNAAALIRLAADPSLITVASTGLIPWVLAGYVPTNAAYQNATYPGDPATTGADGLPLNGTIGPLGVPVPIVYGTMAVTTGPDTLAGSAGFRATASMAVTLGSDTCVGAATSGTIASMVVTLNSDTLTGFAAGSVIGSMAVTLGDDICVGTGAGDATATMGVTLSSDVFVGTGGGSIIPTALVSFVSPARATIIQ